VITASQVGTRAPFRRDPRLDACELARASIVD